MSSTVCTSKGSEFTEKCTEMTDVWCGIIAVNAFIFRRLVVVGLQKKKKERKEKFKGTHSWWRDRWQVMNGCALRNVYVICLIHCHCEWRRQREMAIWEWVEKFLGGKMREPRDGRVQKRRLDREERAAIFSCSKTQLSLNQNPTQEEHLSSLIKDQPARY